MYVTRVHRSRRIVKLNKVSSIGPGIPLRMNKVVGTACSSTVCRNHPYPEAFNVKRENGGQSYPVS